MFVIEIIDWDYRTYFYCEEGDHLGSCLEEASPFPNRAVADRFAATVDPRKYYSVKVLDLTEMVYSLGYEKVYS